MNNVLLILILMVPGIFFSEGKDESKRIVCFGNSITAGYGLEPNQAYPAILEEKLVEAGHPCEVVNAGLSGETSAGGLNRIEWILKNPLDIFILELGGNDGLRGLPLHQTKKNLQAIIDKVKEKYPASQIVIAGMMVPPNMGETYGEEFVEIYPDLAKKNDAHLIPFLLNDVGGDPDLNLSDGIHPNPKGHEIIAQTVFDIIKNLIDF